MYMHRHGGDVYSEPYEIDFSANINPFGMPQSVKDAAWEGVLSLSIIQMSPAGN